jgi:hypothetical protein
MSAIDAISGMGKAPGGLVLGMSDVQGSDIIPLKSSLRASNPDSELIPLLPGPK